MSGPQGGLGLLHTASLPDTVVTLRLVLRQTNGHTTERRVRLHIDRTPPKITSFALNHIWRFEQRAVTVTLRNPSESKQRLELKGKETYLLDYTEGKKYELIGLQGQRSLEIGPNEQVTLRATFKAPQNATNVSVVIDDIGTFDDVQLAR